MGKDWEIRSILQKTNRFSFSFRRTHIQSAPTNFTRPSYLELAIADHLTILKMNNNYVQSPAYDQLFVSPEGNMGDVISAATAEVFKNQSAAAVSLIISVTSSS